MSQADAARASGGDSEKDTAIRPVGIVIGPTPDPRLLPIEPPVAVAWLARHLPERWRS